MKMEELKLKVKNLISNGKTARAIDACIDFTKKNPNYPEFGTDLIALKSRFTSLRKKRIRGTISSQEEGRETNQIVYNLLDLIDSTESETGSTSVKDSSSISPKDSPDLIKTILFLTANPSETAKLDLDREFAKISHNLQDNHGFDLKSEWNVTIDDLQESLLKHKPQIIHFSGHGTGSATDQGTRGIGITGQTKAKGGIIFENDKRESQVVPQVAFKNLFKILAPKYNIKVVVLNACYSELQAQAINEYVPYVVGMNNAIKDEAAITFSSSFYNALAFNENDIETAFELGVNQIELKGLGNESIPVLLKK